MTDVPTGGAASRAQDPPGPARAHALALDPAALRPFLRDPDWLDAARDAVAADPAALPRRFALAGRRAGRGPLHPVADPSGVVHGTADDAARAALVVALATVATGEITTSAIAAPELAALLTTLYDEGDTAERRGVLRGLDALAVRGTLPEPLVTAGIPLAEDALRANDTSLVAAGAGPFGGRHLDAHTWRHAVLKLVFLGVPLDAVAHLAERADAELARMARDLAAERRAAGRDVPPDLARLLGGLPAGAVPPAGTSTTTNSPAPRTTKE
ncbi:EboA domain-containing protein [Myceligenerans crystallogenes]|uniref:Sugar phosphate isomerase/epimerase n=1 Tax=Myceligenerans crystallogenes TaxID=316335 RepID=A0ABP4ZWD6_9MICO